MPPTESGIAAQRGGDVLERVRVSSDRLTVADDGVLEIDGCAADALVAEFGSPLYVTAEETLRANYRRIASAFASVWPAGVNVLYAIKANNNLAVRAILAQEGAGGDVFGEGELYATLLAGADPALVVLNGPNKSFEHLRTAARLGACINVDAEDEIDYLEEIAESDGLRPRVGIRVRVTPDGYDPQDSILVRPWGFSTDRTIELVRRILKRGVLELVGFHMHVGRHSQHPDYHRTCHRAFAESILAVSEETDFAPSLIDIGGGFARERDAEALAHYATRLEPVNGSDPFRNPYTPEDYAAAVAEVLLDAFAAGELPTPSLWLEPGRYICGNATVLLVTVGAVKQDAGLTWVNVDASINNLMRREIHGYHYEILPASRLHDPYTTCANVVGPLCTGGPLGSDVQLPSMRRGDIVAFLDAGMYAETLSTQLNGRPRPATVLVKGGDVELIKEAETVQDVFAHHRIPERLRVSNVSV
jgi:diaminopimelate decarboxylase